jgi:hypothetical protein
VDVEITPEPSADERAAILAALAEELGDEHDAAKPAQGFLTNGEDSVRP